MPVGYIFIPVSAFVCICLVAYVCVLGLFPVLALTAPPPFYSSLLFPGGFRVGPELSSGGLTVGWGSFLLTAVCCLTQHVSPFLIPFLDYLSGCLVLVLDSGRLMELGRLVTHLLTGVL